MQNNSKTNTALLVIIVILLATIVYALFNKPVPQVIDNTPVVTDGTKPKPIVKKEEIPGIVFLKELLRTNPQIMNIAECSYNRETYFFVRWEATGDAGSSLFDVNGVNIGTGGAYTPKPVPVSDLYKNVVPACKKIIYDSTTVIPSIPPQSKSPIDLYHLKP